MLFLTRDEIVVLTGRKRPSSQIAVLRKRRIPFELDGDGRPVVLRDACIDHITGRTKEEQQKIEPDWSAL